MDKHQIDAWLTGMRAGSNEDFAALYSGTKRGVFAFLYTYYRNEFQTEDAMQNVYLKIKLNIDKYRPGTDGRAWMLEIAKNLALNDLKARAHDPLPLDEALSPAGEAPVESGLAITDLIRRTVSPEDARIITLHVLMGYKHREIGKLLGLPTGTVTSRYKRAMDKIRAAWMSGDNPVPAAHTKAD